MPCSENSLLSRGKRKWYNAVMSKLPLFCAAALAAGICAAGDCPFQAAEMTNVSIRAGFWLPRFETNRVVTVRTDFKKSEETGRIHNFMAAGKREGRGFRGNPYDDSDVYKIVEGAAYTLSTHPDPELEKMGLDGSGVQKDESAFGV